MPTTNCPGLKFQRNKRSGLARKIYLTAISTPVGRSIHRLIRHRRGATMLETVLLLAAIAIPSYVIIQLALRALLGFYQMMVTLIHLPFP